MYLSKKCLFLVVMVLLAMTGCRTGDVIYGPNPNIETRGDGPPRWAPAHGYRAKHHYRYYPEAQVYFNEKKGLYSYHRHGRWDTSSSLPETIRIDARKYVVLEMDTDRPYRYHSEIKKTYPPKKNKKPKEKGKDKDKKKNKDNQKDKHKDKAKDKNQNKDKDTSEPLPKQ